MRILCVVLAVAGCSSKAKDGAAAPPVVVPVPAADAVCSADGWCWERPRPQGNALLAALAIAKDDVWAVGEHGTIVHFDGTGWRRVASPTTYDLRGVWAASPRDLWAVGSDGNHPVILRGDGAAWRAQVLPAIDDLPPAYDGVWGSGPDDVWVVGHGGAVLHWDGKALRAVDSGVDEYLHAVWGTGPADVIAVGDGGTVLHWDGKAWTDIHAGYGDLSGVRDGWITGDDSTVLRWNAGAVERVHRDGEGFILGTALELGGTLWIPQTNYDRPGRRVGNGTIEDVDALGGHTIEAFAGVAADDVWAVGEEGFIARWNGKAWTIVHGEPAPTSIAIGDAVWATAYRHVDRYEAGGWRERRRDDGLGPVFALGAHAWLPRHGEIVHWDGARWREEPMASSAWPRAVWARAPDDVWAAASEGTVHHFDGKKWRSEVVDADGGALGAIWGSGAEVWVGGRGRVYRHDGRAWSSVAIGVDDDVVALHGTGPADVWAVTWDAVVRWDGTAWRPVLEDERAMFSTVLALGPGEVYVGDHRGGLRRWDGTTWTAEDSGTGCEIRAIASGAGNLWAASACGLVRRPH